MNLVPPVEDDDNNDEDDDDCDSHILYARVNNDHKDMAIMMTMMMRMK